MRSYKIDIQFKRSHSLLIAKEMLFRAIVCVLDTKGFNFFWVYLSSTYPQTIYIKHLAWCIYIFLINKVFLVFGHHSRRAQNSSFSLNPIFFLVGIYEHYPLELNTQSLNNAIIRWYHLQIMSCRKNN